MLELVCLHGLGCCMQLTASLGFGGKKGATCRHVVPRPRRFQSSVARGGMWQ